MNIDRKVDVEQINKSAQRINDLIEREIARGIAPEHIVIAGFSQGGAVAYHVALSYPQRLAGLLTLSTYLATNDHIDFSAANKDLPILINHGTHDPVVPAILGDKACKTLESRGYDVAYRTYPMAHQVCMPQIRDIGEWLNEVLA